MPKFAVIESGKVANIVKADEPGENMVPWRKGVVAGASWDGRRFTAPSPDLGSMRAAMPAISMRQCRLALLSAGLLDDVPAAIAALPSPEKEVAEIEWEYAHDIVRTAPLVAALASALGLTAEQVDTLFQEAATL